MTLNRRDFVKKAALGASAVMIGDKAISNTFSSPAILRGKDDRVVRLGIIGVGGMGTNLLRSCIAMPDVQIPAICDISTPALTRALDLVEASGRKRPDGYSKDEHDYLNLVNRDEIDAVIIATPW